jgi:hypothetical protein
MDDIVDMISKLTDRVDKLSCQISELNEKLPPITSSDSRTHSDSRMEKSVVIKVIRESEFIYVSGDYETTSKIKDILKINGAKWNYSKKSWAFSSNKFSVNDISNIVSISTKLMLINVMIEIS